jgi:anion-transporting  ArsA/GET3 family ATPase
VSTTAPAITPAALVAEQRVVVCVGSGGVGKTTLAAALALAGARRGRRTLVLTIDPARRLADAMGLESLGHEPQRIGRDVLERLDVPPEGRLDAMMLDMKRTFDALVERFAESPETRERILANPIYQHVSDALAGSAEYSAMEKVYELAERDDLDLIVLDTPPSQHALDFLEAPERLIGLLDSRIVQLLLHPALAAGRMGFRIFHRGLHQVFRIIERVSGLGFLEDISEFLLLIEGMSEGFRERAYKVRGLLFGPQTGFVLAAGPADESVLHATHFLDRLEASKAPVRGLVVNRARRWPEGEVVRPTAEQRPAAEEALAEALAADGGPSFPAREAARAALAIVDGYAEMVASDARATAPLRQRAGRSGYFVRQVPELPRDVHDLDGLALIARLLCEDVEAEEGPPG